MRSFLDASTLASVAGVISAFGVSMLPFRLQRENEMDGKQEIVWLPVADWLWVAAITLCLLLAIVPLTFSPDLIIPTAAVGSSAILVAGYTPAIMAHYRIAFARERLFWGPRRNGPRQNPEPSERILVWTTAGITILFFLWRILLPST